MPKAPPGNPEWLEWVQGMVDRAEERGEKSYQTYVKARNSLRDCPIPMTHPDEALALKGIGAKIVGEIRRKMEIKAAAMGLPMPDRVGPSPTKRKATTTTKKTTKRSRAEEEEAEREAVREARRQRTNGGSTGGQTTTTSSSFQAHPDGAFAGLPEAMDDEDDGDVGGTGKGKGKGKGKTKAYIPGLQTGPYAILLGLYKLASYDEHSCWTLKNDIIKVATPYSRTSFEVASQANQGSFVQGGRMTYTAWSGMKILLEKKLVLADNRKPPRFQLTESGYTLAEQLVDTAGIPRHVYVPSSSSSIGGHPSSSGGGRHPSSSVIYEGGGGVGGGSSFRGQGQLLGSSIHANVFRRRDPTPDDFLCQPSDVVSVGGRNNDDEDGDEDVRFQEEMRIAMERSRRDTVTSSGGGGVTMAEKEDPVARIARMASMGGSASGSGEFRPSVVGTSAGGAAGQAALARSMATGMNGRRAASGQYAASTAAKPVETPTLANVDGPFGYFYLDEDDKRTKNRNEAEVTQNDDATGMLYRIEYRVAQDMHAFVRGLHRPATLSRTESLPGGKTKSAYMKERVSNSTAPGFPDSVMGIGNGGGGVSSSAQVKERRGPSDDPVSALLGGFKETKKTSKDAIYEAPAGVRRLGSSAAVDPFAPVGFSLPSTSRSTAARSHTFDAPTSAPLASTSTSSYKSASQPEIGAESSFSRHLASAKAPKNTTTTTTTTTTMTSPKRTFPSASSILATAPRIPMTTSAQNPMQTAYEPPPGQILINRHPLDPVRDYVSTSQHTFPPFRPIVWPVGSFKVFLVIDTREGTREAGVRIELCEKMKRLGVNVDSKMLPLGDMIWVARKVDAMGRATGEEDVVLDAIVERKRMDDLIKSIQDGRYIGQKIRLKDSGITHRIYLVEKFDSGGKDEQYKKAIWTCKSQLQVNDGFLLHESANIDETCKYLRNRTQVMTEVYENEEIYIIPDDLINRTSYLALQQHLRSTSPSHRYLTSYSMFQELNRSDATLTLRTQWAQMIQRVQGISAEKAVQFLGRWKTPIQFFEEAKRWEIEVERENRRIDQEEREKGGRTKVKRLKKEDFVTNELDDVRTRGIKGKVGARIWDLFMQEGRYTN